MKVAFVFPGQGSQYPGMGREILEKFPVSRTVFHEADAALDFPISRLCLEGSEEDLKLTENTQPAILTTVGGGSADRSPQGLADVTSQAGCTAAPALLP